MTQVSWILRFQSLVSVSIIVSLQRSSPNKIFLPIGSPLSLNLNNSHVNQQEWQMWQYAQSLTAFLGTAVHSCHHSTWKVETEGQWVQGQPGPHSKFNVSLDLHKETLSPSTKGWQPDSVVEYLPSIMPSPELKEEHYNKIKQTRPEMPCVKYS